MRSAITAIFISFFVLGLPRQAPGQGLPEPGYVWDLGAPASKAAHGPEKMVVIDAATREKERERARKQHDTTFDTKIMDIGVDTVSVKSSQRPAESPAKAKATATPKAEPSPAPSLTPIPKAADVSAPSSLSLEVVPILKSSPTEANASPSPSASARPEK
jgi:hypothetical protein